MRELNPDIAIAVLTEEDPLAAIEVAKELNIPVIALAQLSRAVEVRGGSKRPQLSDLRESGSLEQDSDVVVFLYRPEYYQIKEDMDGAKLPPGLTEAIIAKNRHGARETIDLTFVDYLAQFRDFNSAPDFDRQYNLVSLDELVTDSDGEELPF